METDYKLITKSPRKIFHNTYGLSWELYNTTTHFLKGFKTLCGKTVRGNGWLKDFSEDVNCKQCLKIINKKKVKKIMVREIAINQSLEILPIVASLSNAVQQRLFEGDRV